MAVTARSQAGPPVAEAAEAKGATLKRVLNTGCGPDSPQTLHAAFKVAGWAETRLDLNPDVQPDIVGSIRDMRAVAADATYDAIWCSHNLEHLHPHEIVPALREFRRILKPTGFALVTCPDLEAISHLVVQRGLDTTIYTSPAGPITPLDMIYGHVRSVAEGNMFMCHHSGFTAKTLGTVALRAGFSEARVASTDDYALWALFLMPDAGHDGIRTLLAGTKEAFLSED